MGKKQRAAAGGRLYVRSYHCSNAASDVHNAGAGKVEIPSVGEPGVVGPSPVDNNGVDEARDDNRVDEVSHEVGSAGHGTRDDR